MTCSKCHGLSVMDTESLDQQLTVTVLHCLNCGLRTEVGHTPVERPIPGQVRPPKGAVSV